MVGSSLRLCLCIGIRPKIFGLNQKKQKNKAVSSTEYLAHVAPVRSLGNPFRISARYPSRNSTRFNVGFVQHNMPPATFLLSISQYNQSGSRP